MISLSLARLPYTGNPQSRMVIVHPAAVGSTRHPPPRLNVTSVVDHSMDIVTPGAGKRSQLSLAIWPVILLVPRLGGMTSP